MAARMRGNPRPQSNLTRKKSFKVASALSFLSKSSTLSYARSGSGFKMTEPRCIKYSPCVKPQTTQTSLAKYDFEALMWRGAFDSMGQLKNLGLKEEKPFCQLNKAPYHCRSLAREFKASYGSHIQPGSLRKTEEKQELFKKHTNYLTLGKINLPQKMQRLKSDIIPEWLLYGKKPRKEYYLPPSSIRVKFGNSIVDNIDLICDWFIKTFSPFLFIIREGPKSMVVVYEDIWTAYHVVNAGIPPRLLHISWCDCRFNNFGHLKCYSKYTVSTDEAWTRGKEKMQ